MVSRDSNNGYPTQCLSEVINLPSEKARRSTGNLPLDCHSILREITYNVYHIIKCSNQIISENKPYNLRLCTITFQFFLNL